MNHKVFKGLFICVLLYSCGESQRDLKEFNKIKTELLKNYQIKNNLFNNLTSYFRLNHIKYISISEDQVYTIRYKINSGRKSEPIKEVKFKVLDSKIAQSILQIDSMTTIDLIELRKILFQVSTHEISIVDNYDATRGKPFKMIDLKFDKGMNGLNFFYRIYQQPIDSVESASYGLLINDSTGGILNKNTIWYYR